LVIGSQEAAAADTPNEVSGFFVGLLMLFMMAGAAAAPIRPRPTTTLRTMNRADLRRSAAACWRRISSTLARRSLVGAFDFLPNGFSLVTGCGGRSAPAAVDVPRFAGVYGTAGTAAQASHG
jgi:hypothetical protein